MNGWRELKLYIKMPAIKNFPAYRQYNNDTCGASALQMVLAYYGLDFKESFVAKIAGTVSSGTPIEGIKKVAKAFGLKITEGEMTVADLKKNIKNGVPTIIGIQSWTKPGMDIEQEWHHGHFIVPIKYDRTRIYFADPAFPLRTYLTFTELEKRWRDKDKKAGHWRRINHYGLAFSGKKPAFQPGLAVRIGRPKKRGKMFGLDYIDFSQIK